MLRLKKCAEIRIAFHEARRKRAGQCPVVVWALAGEGQRQVLTVIISSHSRRTPQNEQIGLDHE